MLKKTIRLLMTAVLVLALAVPALPAAQAAGIYRLGDHVEDFTVTTWDGRTVSLYELLEGKDAVLINLWATWCDPCRFEFPHMQTAYEQYGDRIEIIALDIEATDTSEDVGAYVQELGLTFPAALDTAGVRASFGVSSYPTSIIIDRFGNVAMIASGAIPSAALFGQVFDAFIGDDYTATRTFSGIPPARPTATPADDEQLSFALTDGSGSVVVRNMDNPYVWPMLPAEKDGRSVLQSTNTDRHSTSSGVEAVVTAGAGDAIAVTLSTSAEYIYDRAVISLNGETRKIFTGIHGWTTYAIPVEKDGEYTVAVSYHKDNSDSGHDDMIWVDEIAVLSGDEAAEALAANPSWTAYDEIGLTVTNENAREVIVKDDKYGTFDMVFGNVRVYITADETADVHIAMDSSHDPEVAYYRTSDGESLALLNRYGENGGSASVTVDHVNPNGFHYAYVLLYPDVLSEDLIGAMVFPSEEALEEVLASVYLSEWSYADEASDAPVKAPASSSGMSAYTLTFHDQHGDPVPGVIAQVCNEGTCIIYTSGEDGLCAFELEPGVYEVHILMAPAGYTDSEKLSLTTPVVGGELAFTLVKD